MRVAAHLVRGGRSLGHKRTLPEEDTSVTHNSYGPHILLFSFHSFIFDFFQLEEYPLHKLHSVELSDGCSQTHSEETETPFVNRLLKMLTGIIFLHSHNIFSISSFKLATAYWLDTAGHPSLDSSDCSSISPFSTHFVSQSSNESPGPCPHLRARVKNAHPQINDRVRVNREWWRRRNLPSSQSAVAALSSRGRGNPAPQEVSLQFQSFKVFPQSFKISKSSLKVSKSPLRKRVGETVIQHAKSLKLHTTGKLKHVLIWFQQCSYHIQTGGLGISTLYSTLIGNSFFLVPHQQPIGGNIIEEMPPMSRSRPCNEDLRSRTFFTASRVSVAVGHMFFCQDLICHKT